MPEQREDIYGRHAIGNMPPLRWWQILGPGHTEGWLIPDGVDPAVEFFYPERSGLHHASSVRSPWGNEFTNPTTWCRDRWCRSTNWGGRGRLHLRFPDCPPFDPLTVQVPEREQLAVESGQSAAIKRVNP